ncbi:[acyl-carrier-protein] S-malonyltransferase [Tumebacillus algifaecis]|uniref:[acyl-carrier-protein] S-malonyltransferase n=1 Tax=Tumebacillus algifaecis TaxID=1214604 RepID=A0A223CXI5_9BACL|nr:ACP S-malonyltransferase [Tumebacillus algifaecis]ASS74011.1 [acyl-carrier-protein] S-malonyltransferase [Tumebacillus algifaecis]
MNKIVAMFPGQASQFVGMGKFWIENHESVRQRFAEASEILGFDLAALCLGGPALQLNQTENTQVALLTSSVAMFEVFQKETGIKLDYLAGHSIGELSALTAAGVFQFADGVRIARARGEAMSSCNAGGTASMSAVTRIKGELVETVVAALDGAGHDVQVANYNSPTQTILSGSKAGLALAGEQLEALGARVVALNVSGPFHSRYMADASEALANVLQSVTLGTMAIPVMNGQEGRLYTAQDDVKAALVSQLTAPVRWTSVLDQLSAQGVRNWLEMGPGTVLKKLVLQTVPEASAFTYDQEADRADWVAQEAKIRESILQAPNAVGLCLGAAVSTRNLNWDEAAYQTGVVQPYKEIQALHEKIEQEKRLPETAEMVRAFALLKTIFQTKGTPLQDQAYRLQRIVKQSGTEELFPEHLEVVEGGR